MMTDKRIEEIKARLEAATPGPWEDGHHQHIGGDFGTPNSWTCVQHDFDYPPYEGELEEEHGIYPPLGEAGPVALVSGEANAQFLAQSWQDIRDLLAGLDQARREKDAAVQAAMKARAMLWAAARALGLPDERVEELPAVCRAIHEHLSHRREQFLEIQEAAE